MLLFVCVLYWYFFLVFSFIFILLSQESDQCAVRARLGAASHLSTTPRREEFRQVPFPTAQVNLPACSSHCPFNAERQAGKL